MRLQALFLRTLREAPPDAETPGAQWLARAGYTLGLGGGLYAMLPLGQRALQRLTSFVCAELEARGAQALALPPLEPAEHGREGLAGHAATGLAAELARRTLFSYRQLPQLVYQLQTSYHAATRARSGLLGARATLTARSWSFDESPSGREAQYESVRQAYAQLFAQIGAPLIVAHGPSEPGQPEPAEEYAFLTPAGPDTFALCDECGYSANHLCATARKPAADYGAPLPLEAVETPAAKTIAALATFLNIPTSQTGKAVFFVARLVSSDGTEREQFITVVVRGDTDVHEGKLINALHTALLRPTALRPATDEEILAHNMVPGYAAPLRSTLQDAPVLVDRCVTTTTNLVVGANQPGYHVRHANYGRDFVATLVADLVNVAEGDACLNCGAPLRLAHGVVVGRLARLDLGYTDAIGAQVLDAHGAKIPVRMSAHTLDLTRLLACLAETHHDAYGLRLPAVFAPFDVHLVALTNDPAASDLYQDLQATGLSVLFDDREESAGVKFTDADLIGAPVRLTVSARSLKEHSAELKQRTADTKTLVPLDQVVDHVLALRSD